MHQHPGDDSAPTNYIGESTPRWSGGSAAGGADQQRPGEIAGEAASGAGRHLQPVVGDGPRRCPNRHEWHRAMMSADDLALRRADGRARVSTERVKVVLSRLYAFMDGPDGRDPGGNAHPGPELLARETGLSVSVVKAALRAGVDHGWIVQTDAGGGRGRAATYAASMPVDNPERGGPDHPFRDGKGWSRPPVSAERGGLDPRKGWSGPPPPSSTASTPTVQRASPAHQLPLVAPVGQGGGGSDGQLPDPAQVARLLAQRIGLQLGWCPVALTAVVAARLADGWTLDALARNDTVAGPLPAEGVASPAGLLRRRLELIADVDPPAVAARRRRAELQAELAASQPLRAPGRPAGPTVDLEQLLDRGADGGGAGG